MMTRKEFESCVESLSEQIEQIRRLAYQLHEAVNQTYGGGLPYGYHLDMVANGVRDFGHLVCAGKDDVLPLFFAAYYHDSIEDARQTYNDVKKTASGFMTDEQVLMATEVVYALTNEKGRSRAERAGEKYYKGIRETPYAPFVKLCDRLANVSFSCSEQGGFNQRMKGVYRQENEHFLTAIDPHSDDPRFAVPQEVVRQMTDCLADN